MMKNHSKKQKRVDIRLDDTTHKLLEDLALRFNTNKTEIIKQALMLFAASKKHVIKIAFYKEEQKTELTENEIQKLIEIANTPIFKK